MAYPKIIWDGNTLAFSYPPVQKPGTNELRAERQDETSSSGLLQSITQRVEQYKTLTMSFVPHTDAAAWAAFMAWAIRGKQFDYFPDADLGDFVTYTLVDTVWQPQYVMQGIDKFTLRLRAVEVL